MRNRTYDVVTLGLQCIDLVMAPVPPGALERELTRVDRAQLLLGGDALNQAVTLSRLGARVALMGLVGNDRLGDVLLEQLSAYPMTVLDHRADVNTAISVVLVDGVGERHFIYQPDSNNALARAHIDMDAVRDAAFLSVGGCLLLPGLDGADLCDVLDQARAAGTKTVLDFRVDSGIPAPDGLRALFSRTDYLMPSLQEAEAMVGRADSPAALADRLRALGGTNCVIKMGEAGCYVAADGFEGAIPACRCRCVDTTGAGDSFVAAFLYGMTRGWDVARSARFANAAGSITVEHSGANGAIHSAEQVLERMGEGAR